MNHFLNKNTILEYLTHCTESFNLHILDSVDSTNEYLKALPKTNQIEICIAEQQTNGRGRFGRIWHSPAQENLYFSLKLNISAKIYQKTQQLSGASLIASLATLKALQDSGIKDEHLTIKWPNDILWQDKKLSGSLIELGHGTLQPNQNLQQIIIGIGINVNECFQESSTLKESACSLYEINGFKIDRNLLSAKLYLRIIEYLNHFMIEGFQSFLPAWEQYDYLKNKKISVKLPREELNGIACGINNKGELILTDQNNKIHYINSGEATLQKKI